MPRLPKDLIGAINTYYAFKYVNSNRMFIDGTIKNACCENVCRIANEHNYDCTIVPGTVFLARGKTMMKISQPISPLTPNSQKLSSVDTYKESRKKSSR